MKSKILGILASILIRILRLTLRYKLCFNSPQDEEIFLRSLSQKRPSDQSNYILAFFHQDELALLPYFINKDISILVSHSKDGEIMTQATKRLGFIPIRGSSSRGAVAGLIACIRAVREGFPNAIAVDGPRGPIYEVKEGVIALSKKTNTLVIPLAAECIRAKIFEKAWNKATLPYPFSTVSIKIGRISVYEKEELQVQLKMLKGIDAN